MFFPKAQMMQRVHGSNDLEVLLKVWLKGHGQCLPVTDSNRQDKGEKQKGRFSLVDFKVFKELSLIVT